MTDRDQIIREAFDESITTNDARLRLDAIRDDTWLHPEPDDLPGRAQVIALLASGALWIAFIAWGLAALAAWVLA